MDATRQRLALGAGAVVVTAAVVAGLVVVNSDDDPVAAPVLTPTSAAPLTTSAAPLTSSPVPTTAVPSSTPSPTPAPTRPTAILTSLTPAPDPTTDVVRATGRTVTARRAGLSLVLPRTWRGASAEDGPEAAARQLYPGDPARQGQAVDYVKALPTSTLLLGLDVVRAEAGAAFTPNLVALVDASVPASYDLQRSADAEVAGLTGGFSLQDRATLDFGAVEAVRLTYRVTTPASVGVAYVLKERGVTYVLTYSFAGLSRAVLALANGSAATVRLSS